MNGMDDESSKHQELLEDTVLLDKKTNQPNVIPKGRPVLTPNDRHHTVYLIFLLHGVGVLMAWNMFITAKSYFVDFKLGNRLNSSTVLASDVAEYRSNFLSYVGIAAQIPNVLCNAANLFVKIGNGNLTARITTTILIEILVFIVTILFALVDSSEWPGTFFYLTMGSVVVMNMANGVYQSTLYAVVAKLPMSYSNAVVLGSNISGTLTTIINIISKALAPDPRSAAVYYFVGTLAVLIACLISFHMLPLNKFYRHFDRIQDDEMTTTVQKRQYMLVFKHIWPQCLNVFTVFFVTLSIFPAVHANISSTGQLDGALGSYFTLVTCFFVFNFCAMIGNLIPNIICWPGPNRLWIPVFVRFLFIPFFLMCNYKPEERSWPVWVNNDYVFVVAGSLLGLSSGYYSSLSMMYAPRQVDAVHAETAAMMASFFLMLGIFMGINSSFILSAIVT